MQRLVLLMAIFWACGCGPGLPTPFTASDMAETGSGAALVHYLRQPGATAAVCDQRSKGPRFTRFEAPDLEALTGGLLDGEVPAKLFQRCAMLMLRSAEPMRVAPLLDAMAHGYRRLLSSDSIEHDSEQQERLSALHRTVLLRPRGTAPNTEAVEGDVAALRQALDGGLLGPFAARHGRELLVSIDLERGRWRGKKLTVAVLDELAKAKDEKTLRKIAQRVPDAALEREARRRIVRLHIAQSRHEEVREHAAEVEARVLKSGRNAIDVRERPPTSAWLDDERARVVGVRVRQHVKNQTVTLLAETKDEGKAAVIPSVKLRGALFARVEGMSEPITLCAPVAALDVTPCLDPADLHPTVPIVRVDDQALLHFVERITARDAQRLVYNTPNLPLPFEINGRTVLTVQWPIVFERPEPVVFAAPMTRRGPDLRVVLERRYGTRLLFEVAQGKRRFTGVVEERDFPSFSIASVGGAGVAGRSGSNGSNGTQGSSGMSASCPGSRGGNGGNGGNGGRGTNGGPGGPGGAGGNIEVQVTCVTGDCSRVMGAARAMVKSQGGAGGPGGAGGLGGRGGAGGLGGSGTSCTDSNGRSSYVSGGSAGMRGSDGSPGSRGAGGPPGSPGQVRFFAK